MSISSLSSEKIAVIHIITGAAQTILQSAENVNSTVEKELHMKAGAAIAFFHRVENKKRKLSSRWGHLTGAPTDLSLESIELAKGKIITGFSEKYSM